MNFEAVVKPASGYTDSEKLLNSEPFVGYKSMASSIPRCYLQELIMESIHFKFADRAYGLDTLPSEVSVQVGNFKTQGKVYLRRQDKSKQSVECLLSEPDDSAKIKNPRKRWKHDYSRCTLDVT
ncbi:hypothetical protein GH714_005766 [Hevea brasiliensis]|uniref:Uncharacterized protein n=1 Tax=Hevea brasiliensis TaxID=3981 RepID=A0A6A6KJI9_HEVBR|nr:hypothetical protein GH714_005766 [Hevea brasiliensis]